LAKNERPNRKIQNISNRKMRCLQRTNDRTNNVYGAINSILHQQKVQDLEVKQ